jgi:hypothetical protein
VEKEGELNMMKTHDSQLYCKSIFMTTHNSYRWSITEQLDQKIRGFELDIHDSWTLTESLLGSLTRGRYKGKFKLGHAQPGHEVYNGGGNPRGNNLEKWLQKIADWSDDNEGHAPITIFLDLKKHLNDFNNSPSEQYGLIRLNEQIRNACKDKLFTPKDFKSNPNPTIGDLRNKIIVVLMSFHTLSRKLKQAKGPPLLTKISGWLIRLWRESPIHPIVDPKGAMKTRIDYQEGNVESQLKFEPICFVAFNPEDKNEKSFESFIPSFEQKSIFVTAYPPENYSVYQNKDKLVRTDYCTDDDCKKDERVLWPPFPKFVNFPATDFWEKTDGYPETSKEWIIP